VDAMRQIVETCHKHNVVVGNPHVNAKNHKRLLDEGYRFLISAPLKSYGVVGMAREMAGY
jgi:4-hydroxy-2-oxoheptanedioate aldolase